MDEHEHFSDSIYEEQMHLAERELSSFIAAVTKLYGAEQARLQQRTGSTNRSLWTVRLNLKSEIGARLGSRRRRDWQIESMPALHQGVRSANR